MVDLTGGAMAADAPHQAAAFTAVKLAGQNIIGPRGMRGAALAISFKHFLRPFP